MVLLTMTPAMVAGLKLCSERKPEGWPLQELGDEPSMGSPAAGRPISHAQVIELNNCLKNLPPSCLDEATGGEAVKLGLAELLRGSQVFIEPPKPKKEPTPEFKELMERLKRDEELRSYERMVNQTQLSDAFPPSLSQKSPLQLAHGVSQADIGDEEVSFADVNRQVAVIFNILFSIVACAAAIWMAAWHWSTPSRLGVSMVGGGVVGVAEIAIYAGYLRRVQEAKGKEKVKSEKKEIMDTWVIEGKKEAPITTIPVSKVMGDTETLRKRTVPVG